MSHNKSSSELVLTCNVTLQLAALWFDVDNTRTPYNCAPSWEHTSALYLWPHCFTMLTMCILFQGIHMLSVQDQKAQPLFTAHLRTVCVLYITLNTLCLSITLFILSLFFFLAWWHSTSTKSKVSCTKKQRKLLMGLELTTDGIYRLWARRATHCTTV